MRRRRRRRRRRRARIRRMRMRTQTTGNATQRDATLLLCWHTLNRSIAQSLSRSVQSLYRSAVLGGKRQLTAQPETGTPTEPDARAALPARRRWKWLQSPLEEPRPDQGRAGPSIPRHILVQTRHPRPTLRCHSPQAGRWATSPRVLASRQDSHSRLHSAWKAEWHVCVCLCGLGGSFKALPGKLASASRPSRTLGGCKRESQDTRSLSLPELW